MRAVSCRPRLEADPFFPAPGLGTRDREAHRKPTMGQKRIKLPSGTSSGWVGPSARVIRAGEEARAAFKAREEIRRGARWALNRAERELTEKDRVARQRDYDLGREPVPDWAKKYPCCAFAEGLPSRYNDTNGGPAVPFTGFCGSTTDMGPELRRTFGFYGKGPYVFRTRHLGWVTCQRCLVKLDELLALGLVRIAKERRKPVIEAVR